MSAVPKDTASQLCFPKSFRMHSRIMNIHNGRHMFMLILESPCRSGTSRYSQFLHPPAGNETDGLPAIYPPSPAQQTSSFKQIFLFPIFQGTCLLIVSCLVSRIVARNSRQNLEPA